jgi:hypothetical protein
MVAGIVSERRQPLWVSVSVFATSFATYRSSGAIDAGKAGKLMRRITCGAEILDVLRL